MRYRQMKLVSLPLTILAIIVASGSPSTTTSTKTIDNDEQSLSSDNHLNQPGILSWRSWFGSLYSETQESDPKLAISRLLIDVPNNDDVNAKKIVENSVSDDGSINESYREHSATPTSKSIYDKVTNNTIKKNGGDKVLSMTKSHLSPIILIPGDGGSRLEAKLNKKAALHHYCEKKTDWFDLWLNLSLLVPFALDCWVDK